MRLFVLLCVLTFACSVYNFAQQGSKGRAVLVNLSPPVYSRLARQANIYGVVSVNVTIHPDGKTDVALESGHSVLAQAALDSAKATRFDCHLCDTDASYQLVYSFRLVQGNDCCNAMSVPAKVILETESTGKDGRHAQPITITAEEMCLCHPSAQLTRKTRRSLKCLYLWNCS